MTSETYEIKLNKT